MRLRDVFESKGPWIAFLATVGLAAALYYDGVKGHVLGFAEMATTAVGTTEIGRIVRLGAQVGQAVDQGEVLVELDSTALDAEIAALEAEEQRRAAGAALDLVEARGSRERAVADLEHQSALQREELASARAELAAVREERRRLERLVSDGLATQEELRRLIVREAALAPLASEKPHGVSLAEAALATARGRLVEAQAAPAGEDLASIREALAARRARRAALVVRAPLRGRVAAVLKRPGEVAVAGERVLTLVPSTARVTLCLPESLALRVAVGNRASLVARDAPSRAQRTGVVVSLAPLVELLPDRCRRSTQIFEWGRVAIVEVDGPPDLLAGQAFDVSFPARGGDGDAAAATRPRDQGAAPRLAEVPSALSSASRLEPSGLVWLPELARFLIVSDDTGYPDRDDHAPWLFTMDDHGAFDPQPLVIEGVDQVNDLESIARGADGGVYLLSAQGYSKKGKRPPSRTLFLKVALEGRRARVVSSVHLAPLLEAQGDAFLADLGLPGGTRELEIEGLTVRDGAAYLGLKSPLDEQGRAIVWRLADVDRFLATGSLAPGQLAIWSRLPLIADIAGAPVGGGVSSLLFAPDGNLLVASTPSRSNGGAEGGRLWRVAGDTPELLRKFPGLKPEGLAVSGDGAALFVVFDRDAETPMWLKLPGIF